MTTATARYQPRTENGKSQYNTAIGHFKDQGKLSMLGHSALPYNFNDRMLATAMRDLVDRLRTWDSPEKSRVSIATNDTARGLEIVARCSERRVTLSAEPNLDDDVLRYETKIELHNGVFGTPIELTPNSKAAMRGIGKKSSKIWFHYLTGYLPREE